MYTISLSLSIYIYIYICIHVHVRGDVRGEVRVLNDPAPVVEEVGEEVGDLVLGGYLSCNKWRYNSWTYTNVGEKVRDLVLGRRGLVGEDVRPHLTSIYLLLFMFVYVLLFSFLFTTFFFK